MGKRKLFCCGNLGNLEGSYWVEEGEGPEVTLRFFLMR